MTKKPIDTKKYSEKLDKDELLRLYVNQKLTTAEIGKLYGHGREAIRQRLIKFGIERRSPEECHEGYKPTVATLKKQSEGLQGKKHPLWGKHHSEETREKMRLSHLGQFSGDKHYNWKGGIYTSGGYVFVRQPDHPNATKKGYIRRSHLVAEKALGRVFNIKKGEMTHHVNEIRDDDSPENILVCLRGWHKSLHYRMKKLGVHINV